MRNIFRIEIFSIINDTRANVWKKKIENLGFTGKITDIRLTDIYSIDKQFRHTQLQQIAAVLANPLIQTFNISSNKDKKIQNIYDKFNYALEIGYLAGVTDNIANTTREIIEDLLKVKFTQKEGVYTSQIIYISGNFTHKDVQMIGSSIANSLIQTIHIKNLGDFKKDGGMDYIVPEIKLIRKNEISEVDLNVSDNELEIIGKYGIKNIDDTRRGPLALDLTYMKTIQEYFNKKKRNPTDIELESLAQTWSEHCKHTIFADPIDNIKNGLFKHYIKRATEEIRKKKSAKGQSSTGVDLCMSVFTDNSGAIAFDEQYLVTHKVETHNTPSALDPFGGSITGIVGVNRDTIGFGLGAKPIANYYGFCFANPKSDVSLFKDANLSQKMLSGRRIMDGVIEGVNNGGNQSGIPTPAGFIYFDERYRGKPLVFVGTVGLIPRKIKNKRSWVKKAANGDYIVMVGGRVGKDGIHGATFSSEALDSGSPTTAVQIGDPITQKKLSDALVKEARNLLLYNSITDNGAGGLSCSVAEMAKESEGCMVELDLVPLKYSGLSPWEIWISESQERMTLAVPPKKWSKLHKLLINRGVEATIIGKFTNSGKCIVKYGKKTIMDIDLEFLHNGLPKRVMKTIYSKIENAEPEIPKEIDLKKNLLSMLGRPNITSFEYISSQYDYIVQGNLVMGPLSGRGRINGDAAVIRPRFDSYKGLILSQGLYPAYSDIDTYHMAASSIDTAIRNIVVCGGNLNKIYLLDNFCWCDSDNPFRLGQLKRAARACYDYATAYQIPFISGKDSMFNDFEGYKSDRQKIKISIPPTLLITSMGIIDDINKVISPDIKFSGDLIYLLGDTYEEMGGSEYFSMYGFTGNNVPKVNSKKNMKLYLAIHKAICENLVASGISVGKGGLAVAIAKMSMGGLLGLDINLELISGNFTRDDFVLFSESQGRIIVTINPQNQKRFEKILRGTSFRVIGQVRQNPVINISGLNKKSVVETNVSEALKFYKSTFRDY